MRMPPVSLLTSKCVHVLPSQRKAPGHEAPLEIQMFTCYSSARPVTTYRGTALIEVTVFVDPSGCRISTPSLVPSQIVPSPVLRISLTELRMSGDSCLQVVQSEED